MSGRFIDSDGNDLEPSGYITFYAYPKDRASGDEPMAFGNPLEICPIPVVNRYGVNFYQDLVIFGSGLGDLANCEVVH